MNNNPNFFPENLPFMMNMNQMMGWNFNMNQFNQFMQMVNSNPTFLMLYNQMMQMPNGAIAVNPIIGDATGIKEIVNTENLSPDTQVYDLMGRKITTPQAGRIYIQNGRKVVRTTWH